MRAECWSYHWVSSAALIVHNFLGYLRPGRLWGFWMPWDSRARLGRVAGWKSSPLVFVFSLGFGLCGFRMPCFCRGFLSFVILASVIGFSGTQFRKQWSAISGIFLILSY